MRSTLATHGDTGHPRACRAPCAYVQYCPDAKCRKFPSDGEMVFVNVVGGVETKGMEVRTFTRGVSLHCQLLPANGWREDVALVLARLAPAVRTELKLLKFLGDNLRQAATALMPKVSLEARRAPASPARLPRKAGP